MAHSHNHAHEHGSTNYGRAFQIGIGLNLAFVALEAVYGILSHSLALLADNDAVSTPTIQYLLTTSTQESSVLGLKPAPEQPKG